jgi:hypothetical protein
MTDVSRSWRTLCAAALWTGLALTAVPAAGGDAPTLSYDVAMYADEAAGEQLVVIRNPARSTGAEGTGATARRLGDGETADALRRIEAYEDREDVSVIRVDESDGDGGIEILAQDEDGGEALIRFGDTIEIRAGDGNDSFHFTLGDRAGAVDDGGADRKSVRVHARGRDNGRAVVLLKGLDAAATADFIDDLDDLPREMRDDMKRVLGL